MASADSTQLRSEEDLVALFHNAETPRGRWRIGTEAEKLGLDRSGAPLSYDGPRGVRATLEAFAEHHGWVPQYEYEGAALIALRRGSASITLEPGAQLELSGAPLSTVHETHQELLGHRAELLHIAERLGQHWLGLGYRPFASQAELSWIPKERYKIMREYLPTKGSRGLDMMRRTATVQANLDYESEADAIRKLRVTLQLQPLVTAMFANSPWAEGKRTGKRSERAAVWLDVDPTRTGLLPSLWKADANYETYVQWALDAPMFFLKRNGTTIDNTRQTFREFLKDGQGEHRATEADWVTHLNTLFPESRLQRTIEVRGTDSQNGDLQCSLPALWKGVLYEDTALTAAEALAARFPIGALEALRQDIPTHGLRLDFEGQPLQELAGELLDIAETGLRRLGNLNGEGEDESVHLAPLRDLVSAGDCPADALLRNVEGDPTLEAVLRHASL